MQFLRVFGMSAVVMYVLNYLENMYTLTGPMRQIILSFKRREKMS